VERKERSFYAPLLAQRQRNLSPRQRENQQDQNKGQARLSFADFIDFVIREIRTGWFYV